MSEAPPPTIDPPPPVRAPPQPAGATPGWGPGRVAAGVLALLLTAGVEGGIVSIWDPNLDSLAAILVLQALLAATLILVACVVSGVTRAQVGALGLRPPSGSYIKLAAIAYGVYLLFALVYGLLVQPHQEDVTRDLGFGVSTLGTIGAGLLIVVAAPVSEEIFFRGFMFAGLRHRFSFNVAGPLSAAIFGLSHFTGAGSWAVVPQLAFLGFLLALVYERTGSIGPTIAIHALNNAIAFSIVAL